MAEGIEVRHRKRCTRPRTDGKCCGASFQAQAFNARAGKPIKKSFPTITAAKQWRSDAQAAIRAGESRALTPTTTTVSDALDALLDGMQAGTVLDRSGRQYRPATVRSYREATEKYLKPTLGHYRLGEVRRADVQRLVDRMHADGRSGSTIRNKLDPLRVVYRRAIQDEEVQRTPVDHLRLPGLKTKPRAVVAPERAAELLELLPVRERALWTTLFYGGLRIGEARALRWSHVDFDQGVIRVQAGWDDSEGEQDTKTAAGVRIVPMTARVRAELARHSLDTGRDGDDLCFGRTATAAFTRSTVRARALKAWERSGRVTPHEARHCAASYFAQAGLSIKEAQEALGHADPRTTMGIYQHALPGWQEAAAAKLDAYLGATVARQPTPETVRSTAVPERFEAAG
jgi:integrase